LKQQRDEVKLEKIRQHSSSIESTLTKEEQMKKEIEAKRLAALANQKKVYMEAAAIREARAAQHVF
jgi:hypothetical protein